MPVCVVKVYRKRSDMKELSKRLAESAKQNGICKEWGDRLAACEDDQIDRMMAMYRKGLDFCMDHDWPDLMTMRVFGKGKIEAHGVHCDEHLERDNDPWAVLLGRSDAVMKYDQYNAAELYIRHDTKAEIVAVGHSFVYVDAYDNAKIKITASDHAKVCVKNHGKADIQIERSGDAIVKSR